MALILTGPNSRLQPAVSLETYSHPPPPLLILCELENGTVCEQSLGNGSALIEMEFAY